jgi:hypothetical protein
MIWWRRFVSLEEVDGENRRFQHRIGAGKDLAQRCNEWLFFFWEINTDQQQMTKEAES